MSTTKIYLMTLNSPSRRALRLWTGKSVHTLRHCSVKQIGSALAEMQRNVGDLQADIGKLAQVTKQWVAPVGRGGILAKSTVPLTKVLNGRQKVQTRGSAFFRKQRGDSRGRGSKKG